MEYAEFGEGYVKRTAPNETGNGEPKGAWEPCALEDVPQEWLDKHAIRAKRYAGDLSDDPPRAGARIIR